MTQKSQKKSVQNINIRGKIVSQTNFYEVM